MAKASITISDHPDGVGVNVEADFGEKVDPNSQAHQLINELVSAVLGSAKTYKTVEDTAPELNAEPSLVATADNPTPPTKIN